MDSLEEWLQEMENTLKQPLPLNSRWSKRAINEKMKELKVSLSLQRLFIFVNNIRFRKGIHITNITRHFEYRCYKQNEYNQCERLRYINAQ